MFFKFEKDTLTLSERMHHSDLVFVSAVWNPLVLVGACGRSWILDGVGNISLVPFKKKKKICCE